MNSKDDNQTSPKKYFDVAPPGKAPASSNSRPYYSDKQPVKDFDFADKPADAGASKFDNLQDDVAETDYDQKPGAPDIADQTEQSGKNMLDLDKSEPSADLSEIQSELSSPDNSQRDTDFRPDDFETSGPNPEDEEMKDENPEQEPEFESEKQTSENAQKRTNNQSSSKQKPEKTKSSDSKPKKEKVPGDDAPTQTPQKPQLMSNVAVGEMVVSQHSKYGAGRLLAEIFAVLVVLLLLAGIVNLLLDAGLVTLDGIPHTDFFSES